MPKGIHPVLYLGPLSFSVNREKNKTVAGGK